MGAILLSARPAATTGGWRRLVPCRGHSVDLQKRDVVGRQLRVEAKFALK
jgi:hypothetical protein